MAKSNISKAKLNGSAGRLAEALRDVIQEAITETESRIEPRLVELSKHIKESNQKSQNRHKETLERIKKIDERLAKVEK